MGWFGVNWINENTLCVAAFVLSLINLVLYVYGFWKERVNLKITQVVDKGAFYYPEEWNLDYEILFFFY